MTDELLSIGDCAQVGDVSESAVRLWIKRGKLPCFQTRRGWRVVRRSDLEALLAARARSPRGFATPHGRVLQLPR